MSKKPFPTLRAILVLALLALTALGATVPFSSVVAGGNLSGFYPNPTVAKINATTVTTAGGSLTTGKVLRVTGVASSDWGAVDLANGSAITGTLPVGNIPTGTSSSTVCIGNDARLSDSRAPSGTASGDLSSSYPGPTVAKVNGTTYPAGGSLTTGTIPRVTGASAVGYGALDLANASAVTGLLPIANVASGFTKADGTVAFIGAVSMGSHLINNVTDPSGAQDAATKNYDDTKQFLFWQFGASAAPNTASVRYAGPYPASGFATAERQGYVLVPYSCTIVGLVIRHNVAMTTDSITATVQLDAVDTSITKAIAATVQAGSDLAHTAAASSGQRLSVKLVQSSGAEANSTLDGRWAVLATRTSP